MGLLFWTLKDVSGFNAVVVAAETAKQAQEFLANASKEQYPMFWQDLRTCAEYMSDRVQPDPVLPEEDANPGIHTFSPREGNDAN